MYHAESHPDVVRRGRPMKDVSEATKEWKCLLCAQQFGSQRQLKNHRKEAGHDNRGRAQAARVRAANGAAGEEQSKAEEGEQSEEEQQQSKEEEEEEDNEEEREQSEEEEEQSSKEEEQSEEEEEEDNEEEREQSEEEEEEQSSKEEEQSEEEEEQSVSLSLSVSSRCITASRCITVGVPFIGSGSSAYSCITVSHCVTFCLSLCLSLQADEHDEEELQPLEEGRVVGMRATADGIERFMFWVGYGKDECTYEPCDNTVDAEDVLKQTIQVFDDKGGLQEALVHEQEGSPSNSSSFSLEWLGRAQRRLEKSKRTSSMNLSNWLQSHPNTTSWKAKSYTECDLTEW